MRRQDSPGTRSSSLFSSLSCQIISNTSPLQVSELRKAFDSFDSDKRGAISSETTGTILRMMGVRVSGEELAAIMDDIDVDKSGQLEFEEFVILSARFFYFGDTINVMVNILLRFLSEEDEECLKNELKEAFRIYDKVKTH